ncbi:uncharacterized protein LOC135137902 [Zophobas morio]|uniref:uncharacterized protein LOC135137902 n=1 Tax=Zophobas morio TaxID=2755281 RepID=UPI003082FF4D
MLSLLSISKKPLLFFVVFKKTSTQCQTKPGVMTKDQIVIYHDKKESKDKTEHQRLPGTEAEEPTAQKNLTETENQSEVRQEKKIVTDQSKDSIKGTDDPSDPGRSSEKSQANIFGPNQQTEEIVEESVHQKTKLENEKETTENYSWEKTFRRRPGTRDMGKPYEDTIISNIILNLLNDHEIQDFQISSNTDNFGDFDDVVIETRTSRGFKTRAVQLKHSDRRRLTLKQLARKTGDFSLIKYFNTTRKIQHKAHRFVLFTTHEFQPEKPKFKLEGENFFLEFVKVVVADESLRMSDKENCCYIFRIVEDEENVGKIQEYGAFFEQFCLYTDQERLETLRVSTVNKFMRMFGAKEEAFEKYFKIVSEWSLEDGIKDKLDKNRMQRTIALGILSPQIECLVFGQVTDKMRVLRDAIFPFDLTLVQKSSGEVVRRLWGDAADTIDLNELNKLRSTYGLSSNYINKLEDIDGKILAQLLWLMNKTPLIVNEHVNMSRAIRLCSDAKFILLGDGKRKIWMKYYTVFQSLLSLKLKSDLYNKVTQNFTISLQGKATLTLVEAFGSNEDFLRHLTLNNLLEMLNGPRLIGGDKETLPIPYIERSVSLNIIDIKYLNHVSNNTVIILNCEDHPEEVKRPSKHSLTEIDDFLDSPNHRTLLVPIFVVSKNRCSQSEFDKVCSETLQPKTVHYFKFLSNKNLEWVRSRGDISELHNYKLGGHSRNETEFWSFDFIKTINLVIGDPGMGKTELTKSLKNKCPCDYWTVIVTPQEVNLFYKQSKDRNYLNSFQTFILDEKYHHLDRLDKAYFRMCVKQNRVFYVWDALDEILTKYLDSVSTLIVQLSDQGFTQWVTCRRHLKSFLEKKFRVLSVSINQFNEREQEDYLRTRLDNMSDDVEAAIDKVKSNFAFIKHVDILGIPLQIFMLTEIIRQNTEKYLKLLDNSFLLTDLYHYFIDTKFELFYQNKLSIDVQEPNLKRLVDRDKKTLLAYCEKLALGAIFPEGADVNNLDDVDNVLHDCASIGIITGLVNNTPQFLHASFAEYLVAVYFSKNFEIIPRDTFFDQKYNNVRFFFDMLLARNSPAHIAVLYRNCDVLKHYDDEMLRRKDGGGRSALHLVCSWGQRRSRLAVTKSKVPRNCSYFIFLLVKKIVFSENVTSEKFVIQDYDTLSGEIETRGYLDGVLHLMNKCDVFEPDGLLGMTPLWYSRISESLGVELELLKFQKLRLDQPYSEFDRINILYYSALFGYDDVVKVFSDEQLPTYGEVNFVTTDDNITPLIIACSNGYKKIVDYLLICGAEINHGDDDGRTPLHASSENGHQKTVHSLVKSGAKINCCDNHGRTPLHAASTQGHEKIVAYLVKSGAEVNRPDNDGRTPLHASSENGHLKTTLYLLNSNAKINFPDNDGSTPLHSASENGHLKIVELLLKFGAEIDRADNDGWTPLYAAAYNGYKKTVECLVRSGAEINRADCGRSPLYAACEKGHGKTVEYLVRSGAEFDRASTYGCTPLFGAAANGHAGIVRFLVELGAGINCADDGGRTPLYAAAENGRRNVVEYLVECGAEVNRADNYGWTPRRAASFRKHTEIEVFLESRGARVSLQLNHKLSDESLNISIG